MKLIAPRSLSFVAVMVLGLFACSEGATGENTTPQVEAPPPPTTPTPTPPNTPVVDASTPSAYPDIDALQAPRDIIKAVFAEHIRHSPSWAASAGVRDVDAVLDDLSPAEFAKYYGRCAALDVKLKTIDLTKLTLAEKVEHDKALGSLFDALARRDASTELWEQSNLVDVVDNLSLTPQVQTIRAKADIDTLIAKYKEIPRYLQQRTDNLVAGAAKGLVASKPIVEASIANLKTYYGVVADNPFAALVFEDSVSQTDQDAWQPLVNAIVETVVVPAILKHAAELETKILPGARTTFGYGAMGTVGKTFYASQVKVHTGSTLSVDDIHALGLQRVSELDTAMRTNLTALSITDTKLSDALAKIQAQPEWTPATPAAAKTHVDSVVASLLKSEWVDGVWGLGTTVAAPSVNYVDDRAGSAYYVIGSDTFTIFTKDKPTFEHDAVVTHEFTHYLQDVAAKGLQANAISPYGALFGSTSVVEGAAHYAEMIRLEQPNAYKQGTVRGTALARLGAQGNLMLRAVRLVVDTGIHAKDWTRDQAIQYMKDRLTMADDEIQFEVDRYASFAGQALAYRVGAEGIRKAKEETKTRLGAAFSEKAFNKTMLELSGASLALVDEVAKSMK